ncbi:hypothetical protein FACS1894152_4010 [Bacilli bacterium]|nr:hypothetical protein FACS1894152_4010 [Bacilli bacterium]
MEEIETIEQIGGVTRIAYRNGNTYEGEYVRGRKSGKGKMVYNNENGDRVEITGNWKNDYIDGKGIFKRVKNWSRIPDEAIGEWTNKGKNVKLKYYCSYYEYDEYKGEWADGDMNGCGTLTYGDYSGCLISRCDGEFKNGKMHGLGVAEYVHNDEKYVGEWEHDMPNGYGARYNSQGGRIGTWKNDGREPENVVTEVPKQATFAFVKKFMDTNASIDLAIKFINESRRKSSLLHL